MTTSKQLEKRQSMVEPVKALQSLSEYSSQTCDAPIDLKLDANECSLAPIYSDAFCESDVMRQYPSRTELESYLAKRFEIGSERILVTAGADDAIDRLCRAFLQGGRNIVFPEPSFVMIRKYAEMASAEIRSIPWAGTEFPVQQVIDAANENTAVVAIVSPNNPTGVSVSPEELRLVANHLPHCILLVDQAYAEFETSRDSQTQSLTEISLRELPNTVVIRTFSKAWGLAGLRVGYALGPVELISNLRKVGAPYPVSGPSLDCVVKTLNRQPDGNRPYIERVQDERQQLRQLLIDCQVDALPSEANFVFADFSNSNLSARFVFNALAAQGILVRLFEENENALRITCPGDPSSFRRLSETLRAILAPEAVLFDMDGVLVDESQSYREAIRLTCESFGEAFTDKEIADKKLCGNANNDWDFTYRILQERGCDCDYDDVKERFEQFYQGNQDAPGLWQQEQRLVDIDWLNSLARRYPLAIVTGRPKGDAVRFLESESIGNCFKAVIAMEDGPAKPNPANVRLALEKLGVRSAWMVGDTPDDINAARAAGIVALGIVAPKDEPEFSIGKLNAAHATCVLGNLESLGELLP